MADISYTPTTWADGAEGGTPVNSTRLNNIEQGIVDAVAAIGPNDTTADGTLKGQINNLATATSYETFTISSIGAVGARQGKVVSVRMLWENPAAIADSATYTSIPQSITPTVSDYDFPIINANDGKYVGTIRFTTGGEVRFVFVPNGIIAAGCKFRCTLTYVI